MSEPQAQAGQVGRRANRLAGEASPYLLQHAHNPVDWYPWGPEALARAKAEDKPILLSIGYAACHWCHVMERESFEDPETAALMNQHFIPVKVDREERPDLDAVYMTAVQAMTGQGGWPMTVFLTPDGAPFFAGTYFPKEDRYGMPAFRRVLTAVADAWRNRRDDVGRQAGQIVEHLAQAIRLPTQPEEQDQVAGAAPQPLREAPLRQAFEGLRSAFDPQWGGFGGAPKFPQPMTLEFLLRCHLRGWDAALEMVELTLQRMAAGGIFDQVGGGFHRYATDERWLVPHFEKMLYDNAQLVRVYTHAWQVTGLARYREIACRTADYLLRELRHPDGGFWSSQDADSEGVEGKFFVWDYDELLRVGGEVAAAWYAAVPEGNWEGKNILWTPRSAQAVAASLGTGVEELERAVAAARSELLRHRDATRVHPATDDKVLAAWNGLAVVGLAEAGRAFGEPRYLEAAEAAASFVLSALQSKGGRLLRAWRDGRTGGPGYLDDYACMAAACLTLYETGFEPRWLEEAIRLSEAMLALFADPAGGFYQTGSDAEALVVRPREVFDHAVPAGQSVAAEVLLRLSHLTGEERYERAAVDALRPLQPLYGRAPTGFGHAMGAADFALGPVREVAVIGAPGAPDTEALLAEARRAYRPNQVLAARAPDDQQAAARVPLLADRPMVGGRATAYVCERFVCKQPVSDPEALAAQLS